MALIGGDGDAGPLDRRVMAGEVYDLVCGQGRLEAFVALGQNEIPAIVIEASEEDCYVMSLVENQWRLPAGRNDGRG